MKPTIGLTRRPGAELSKSQIEEKLYGWQEDIESNTVEVHVHHLRSKLGAGVIETVRGLGYRMGGQRYAIDAGKAVSDLLGTTGVFWFSARLDFPQDTSGSRKRTWSVP